MPYYFPSSRRVCYRTTIDKCGNQYRVYLNRRNFANLQKKCKTERENLAEGEDFVVFPSPRYNCTKKSGHTYMYRRSELCLYNISISNCESGRVIIESPSRDEFQQELQGRKQSDNEFNNTCIDYIQFYYSIGNSTAKTTRYCGTELSHPLDITIPATQFMAVFWTDLTGNYVGFHLRATCVPTVTSGQAPDEITP